MDTETFKNNLKSMCEIINLSPARQNQLYFRIAANISEKTLTLVPTLEFFDISKTMWHSDARQKEAEFHVGLAAGCFEAWLEDNNISYSKEEKFLEDNFITFRIE